jgi:cytochrome c peroxidase
LLQGGIVVVDDGRRLMIADACRGSLDDGLPMPASSHSPQLTAIAPNAKRSIAGLILVVFTVCAAERSIAQEPTPQPRAEQEPITPIPPPPAQDPRQVALGDRLFHDPRLSRDNSRSCNSCHDTSTNGATNAASASSNLLPDVVELNIPTVFNVALNFRLIWKAIFARLKAKSSKV